LNILFTFRKFEQFALALKFSSWGAAAPLIRLWLWATYLICQERIRYSLRIFLPKKNSSQVQCRDRN